MSRTTRKPKWPTVEMNEAAYINRELRWDLCHTVTRKRVKKSEQEIKFEKQAANQEYLLAISKNGGKTNKYCFDYHNKRWYSDEIKVREIYIYKFIYVDKVPNVEHTIKRAKTEYKAYTRDNAYNESSVNSNFKRDCARTNRRNNKHYCNKIIKDEWENTIYPDYHDTDYKVWTWW